VTAICRALEVSRAGVHERLRREKRSKRGFYRKADDDLLLSAIRRIVSERPTYGYRRVWAILNRLRKGKELDPVNKKRVYRIMKKYDLLLQPSGITRRPRLHDGKVSVISSNVRWCSDALELSCRNGDVITVTFVIDAYDREVMAYEAHLGRGVTSRTVQDLLVRSVEARFGDIKAPHAVEFLTDNGSCYAAKETRICASALGLVSCFTPVRSPQSNGLAEAFVKTFKRDYAMNYTLTDGAFVLSAIDGWFEDYNLNHPHSALGYRSPTEVRTSA